ncbi:hypothetical protein [Bacillus sp. AFS053548]|nr:hypothetical protein [Bacillus sp. AFS053548]
MENKPAHYDGSGINNEVFEQNSQQEDIQVITEEMRSNLSGNPYIFE